MTDYLLTSLTVRLSWTRVRGARERGRAADELGQGSDGWKAGARERRTRVGPGRRVSDDRYRAVAASDGAADDDEGGRDQLLRRALGAERGGGVLRAGGGAHAILQ